MTTIPFSPKALRLAQYFIQQGSPICFPTETVYALAADATNDVAVSRIYEVKKREPNKPLSLLVRDVAQIRTLCVMNTQAEILLAAFSPGPLTLVLPLKSDHGLSSLMNSGMKTIGLRIPNHPVAQALLRAIAVPLVGTSANISGESEAICAEEASVYLGGNVKLVIDGGGGHVGKASTVVDVTKESPVILRQGRITQEQLDAVCHIQRNCV